MACGVRARNMRIECVMPAALVRVNEFCMMRPHTRTSPHVAGRYAHTHTLSRARKRTSACFLTSGWLANTFVVVAGISTHAHTHASEHIAHRHSNKPRERATTTLMKAEGNAIAPRLGRGVSMGGFYSRRAFTAQVYFVQRQR